MGQSTERMDAQFGEVLVVSKGTEFVYRPTLEMARTAKKRSATFFFSPTNGDAPSPWPADQWYLGNTGYDADGRFDSRTTEAMSKLWIVVRPHQKEYPDVLGDFGPAKTHFPALSIELKEMIESVAPNLCHFVEARRIWDARHECEVGRRYFFTAVRKNFPAAVDNSDLRRMKRSDGSMIYTLTEYTLVKETALNVGMIFRDSMSQQVFCTEQFKQLVSKAGHVGMDFDQKYQVVPA